MWGRDGQIVHVNNRTEKLYSNKGRKFHIRGSLQLFLLGILFGFHSKLQNTNDGETFLETFGQRVMDKQS